MKTLYLLTSDYPYATREAFLETEIKFLCEQFQRVEIIPMEGLGTKARPVPGNCVVWEPIRNTRHYEWTHCFSFWFLPYAIKEFFKSKAYANRRRIKNFLIICVHINNYLNSPRMKKLLKKVSSDDVFYSYWGRLGNSIAPFLYGKVKYVSRFHGDGDLWGQVCEDNGAFRDKVISSLDLAAIISEKGRDYFVSRYNCKKVIISRLGTVNHGCISSRSTDGIIRVVSCSVVRPLKRVDLIYKSLQLFEEDIEWTHIGDGESFEELQNMVKSAKPNIKVILTGSMTNSEVLHYYENHNFDVFVNVSTNEGVPVSIMEAISYNIPAVATNVGATSEVVTPKSGVLVSENPSAKEIKDAIVKAVASGLEPRSFWEERFNAEKNYQQWAKILWEL